MSYFLRKSRLSAVALLSGLLLSAEPGVNLNVKKPVQLPLSLRYEAQTALQRGAQYLIKTQQTDGSWRNFAAITALGTLALHNCQLPGGELARRIAVEKGRKRILADVQPDGAICPANRMYANYSTSVCLATLAILAYPQDFEIMRKARTYLLQQQLDSDHPDQPVDEDSANYGGFGYGGAPKSFKNPKDTPKGKGKPERKREDRADLSCTQWALEALYLSDFLVRDTANRDEEQAKETDLAWSKATIFLEQVQNLQKTGENSWLVTKEKDGGFTYLPNSTAQQGASYGSMTYAGLKSMIYAELERNDPRIEAARDWAMKNYTVDENPGKGANGLYYYLQVMAKSLAIWGEEELAGKNGQKHQWRLDIVRKLIELQKGEGQWSNEVSSRWQESDPQLVTAYAMITLEIALGEKKQK